MQTAVDLQYNSLVKGTSELTVRGQVRKVEELIPYQSSKVSLQTDTLSTVNNFTGYNAGSLNSTSKASLLLTKGSINQLKNLSWHFNITVNTAAVQLAPVPLWFDRIEVRPNGSQGGDTLTIAYGDVMMTNILLKLSRGGGTMGIFENINLDPRTDGSFPLREGPLLPPGRYDFHMPFLNMPWDSTFGLNFESAQQDLLFDFWPVGNIIAYNPSSTGTVSLNTIELHAHSQNMSAIGKQLTAQQMNQCASSLYLDAVQVVPAQGTSFPLTPGQKSLVDLSQLQGEVAFLSLLIRPVGGYDNNVNNQAFHLTDLGDLSGTSSTTIDMVDPQGNSIVGSGSPIETQYIDSEVIAAQELDSDYFCNHISGYRVYILPFCKNIRAAFAGIVDGTFYFPGGMKYQLQIQASQGTNQVQTVSWSPSSTPASGNLRFVYKGEYSQPFAYNASVATIQGIIQAMTGPKSQGLSITPTQFSAGATTTLTIASPGGNVPDLFNIDTQGTVQNSTPVTIMPTTIVTTAFVPGIPAGTTNYDVRVYAYMYNKFCNVQNRMQSYEWQRPQQ